MKNIEDLRGHLFDTLEGLKNKTMDLDRAKVIATTAQVIVDTARVEVELAKVTGGKMVSGFIPEQLPTKPGQPRLVKGIAQP